MIKGLAVCVFYRCNVTFFRISGRGKCFMQSLLPSFQECKGEKEGERVNKRKTNLVLFFKFFIKNTAKKQNDKLFLTFAFAIYLAYDIH